MEINATILVSAISFIVFIFIMNKILYKPVLEIMEKRQNYIDANKNEADEHHKKAQQLLVDKDARVAEAQRTSRDIVASKADAIKEEKSKVLNDTKNSVTSYFSEQKQNLAHQKDEAAANMKHDVADLANRLTTKLMGEGIAFEPVGEQEVEEVMKKNA
ncbi:MAG TPA: ATP synthase F0 subunit B [Candidatus Limenecus avicola]|jgi:ATP synthase subunit b|uniref:ATP synthase subunit b n=1 Tax=Candidatus Limenecus avicola TaxID=2840847 RepID=A0A9D1MZW4_9CLOT|nr:ATP synthase F0 subunit B [Clostridium sp.]HIU92240.1 ATP synthase F0 subunit B [Candidatus Limenecus avicola]